jgi:hypothetical protein
MSFYKHKDLSVVSACVSSARPFVNEMTGGEIFYFLNSGTALWYGHFQEVNSLKTIENVFQENVPP